MIIILDRFRAAPGGLLAPLDFYRFRHRTEIVETGRDQTRRHSERPLWIVGVSPFDPVIGGDDGYVVHLGAPRFLARWSMCEETIAAVAPDHLDEELGIALFDLSSLDRGDADLGPWLLEAVCAVAYSKGLIAVADPVETH